MGFVLLLSHQRLEAWGFIGFVICRVPIVLLDLVQDSPSQQEACS